MAFVILIYSLLIQSIAASIQYFVAKNGLDEGQCGNWNNPCGTLYRASIFVNESSDNEFIINVVDGQNNEEIVKYNNTEYNPCFPKPFDSTKKITISFNVENMNSWLSMNQCNVFNQTYSKSKYIFDGAGSMILNNLMINNYDGSKYGIIRTWYNMTINHSVFNNITTTNNNALFLTASTFYSDNNTFYNIKSKNNIIDSG
eukprot:249271_1